MYRYHLAYYIPASMGSGRGDRNQVEAIEPARRSDALLQWGPVVVTGIRGRHRRMLSAQPRLQWGPVVVTGIRARRWDGP